MIGFTFSRRSRGHGDLAAGVALQAGEAILGLAEELAMDARERVLENRDPARPLPSILADSISVENDGLRAMVRATASYGPYVEFGTRHKAARPFLAPAAESMRAVVGSRIADAFHKILRGFIS